MSDERPTSSNPGKRSWLDRLADAFTGEPKDREDLLSVLKDAQDKDILDNEAFKIIEGALNVSDMHVRDIMIPRSQMVSVETDETIEDWLGKIVESGHSRFPVLGENSDEVVGVLLAKDLLGLGLQTGFKLDQMQARLTSLIRSVNFVPESKRLNVLLKDFRSNRNHMAVVVDEYGQTAGLVTIEDVLEEIVGEIEDEHDDAVDANIRPNGNGGFLVQALTPIEDFNDHFQTEFSDEEFDTIGGIVMHKFGKVPKRDESITLGDLMVRVINADNRRVRAFEVNRLDSQADL
ncbi:magnesium/cobalt efflux protein [Saccharospirillum sp. MSK14-1]|uniref:HlyC/CorC family transporter n=1 Tax=Saccharospirillum sp. MSK14-1 TaxID=1897632 RepID=UPI000D360352|nr:transporter associated domain-containing protein [Saccharospirillum sp. MSK14-1]PTY38895.1 magnesium/cobalt efflux protein [Saccharospirillum sp. MSK14-1]